MLRKIISGAQTGPDRAGLDFAIEVGLEHGGYVRKGRRAEDGLIPSRYTLEELPTDSNQERIQRNIDLSDGTVLFTLDTSLRGGTALAAAYALSIHKPLLHLHQGESGPEPERFPSETERLKEFLSTNRIQVLNVAGPREGRQPGVYRYTLRVLRCYWQAAGSARPS